MSVHPEDREREEFWKRQELDADGAAFFENLAQDIAERRGRPIQKCRWDIVYMSRGTLTWQMSHFRWTWFKLWRDVAAALPLWGRRAS